MHHAIINARKAEIIEVTINSGLLNRIIAATIDAVTNDIVDFIFLFGFTRK